MDNWKEERTYRLLDMFESFQRGAGVGKKDLADKFGVTEKSVQRDVKLLRQYIVEKYPHDVYGNIEYSRIKKQYYWRNRSDMLLNEEEITLLAIILLESRGLTKHEVENIINKMFVQCSPESEKQIRRLIENELYHYKPVRHGRTLGKIILELSEAKQKQLVLEIEYKAINAKKAHLYRIKPLGIMFSEMYFYLLAKNVGEDNADPICYRIDRILSYQKTTEHFVIDYKDRFQEGEFRQQVQFMSTGKLMDVKFRFNGKSLEAVLDRLPNAEIISRDENETVLKAKVFGRGIKMWFLSQAEYLEVIEPIEFREEMKQCIQNMLKNYEN